MAEISITTEQKVHVKLAPVTAAGNPAQIDGPASFEVASGSATVEADSDGLGAYLISGDSPEVSVINVKADADLGEGVREIAESINLTVLSPEASLLGLEIATPEPK